MTTSGIETISFSSICLAHKSAVQTIDLSVPRSASIRIDGVDEPVALAACLKDIYIPCFLGHATADLRLYPCRTFDAEQAQGSRVTLGKWLGATPSASAEGQVTNEWVNGQRKLLQSRSELRRRVKNPLYMLSLMIYTSNAAKFKAEPFESHTRDGADLGIEAKWQYPTRHPSGAVGEAEWLEVPCSVTVSRFAADAEPGESSDDEGSMWSEERFDVNNDSAEAANALEVEEDASTDAA